MALKMHDGLVTSMTPLQNDLYGFVRTVRSIFETTPSLGGQPPPRPALSWGATAPQTPLG